LARALRRSQGNFKKFVPPLMTQPCRTIISEDHYIYRPTDGQPITFSIFVTEDIWGELDITRSIILLPTWFGPTDDVKIVAQTIASLTNWRVFLPNIYGKNNVATSVEEAQNMYSDLDYAQTVQDIGWIARKLRMWQPGSGLSTLGFSAGGAMALEAAASSDDISSAVSFYGLPPKSNWEDLQWSFKSNNKPMQLHFGAMDSVFNFVEAEQFRQQLKQNGNDFQFFSYPAHGHNFMCGEEHASMMGQPNGAGVQQLASQRTADFLLENTPRLDLNALPEEFQWLDSYHNTPNDPEKVSQWKSY